MNIHYYKQIERKGAVLPAAVLAQSAAIHNKISASPVAVTAESNPALNVGEADNSSVAYNSLTVEDFESMMAEAISVQPLS